MKESVLSSKDKKNTLVVVLLSNRLTISVFDNL